MIGGADQRASSAPLSSPVGASPHHHRPTHLRSCSPSLADLLTPIRIATVSSPPGAPRRASCARPTSYAAAGLLVASGWLALPSSPPVAAHHDQRRKYEKMSVLIMLVLPFLHINIGSKMEKRGEENMNKMLVLIMLVLPFCI
jgi:hypothetical protein